MDCVGSALYDVIATMCCHLAISEPGIRELVDSSVALEMLFERDTNAQRPIQWILLREVIVKFRPGLPQEGSGGGMIAGSHVNVWG
jgi:hypothetical protein